MIKFRSFDPKHIELNDNDIQPFFFGKIIRRLSLDEIPQLFNILLGHMSLVGPRPIPKIVEKKINSKQALLRQKVRPGLTGYCQIKYNGKKRDWEEKINLDIFYINNYSLTLYFKILILTIPVLYTRFFKNKSGITN